MWKRTRTSLEASIARLEDALCAARSDYNQDSAPLSSDGETKVPLKPFSEADLIGPDFSGVQLRATPNLLSALETHAFGDCCGARTSFLVDPVDQVWVASENRRRSPVLVKESHYDVEVDAQSLVHWATSLLIPEPGPIDHRLELFVFHPARVDGANDIDKQFIADLQSVFEICGCGMLGPYGTIPYSVDAAQSWDVTAQLLSDAVLRWANAYTDDAQLANSDQKIAVLVVWPHQGWIEGRARSALAAVQESIGHLRHLRVITRVVDEKWVLLERERKSRLVGLSLGLYAMIRNACPVAVSSTTAESEPVKRVHMALAFSPDLVWVCVAWCSPSGHHLGCRVKACKQIEEGWSPSKSNGGIISMIDQVVKEFETPLHVIVLVDSDSPRDSFDRRVFEGSLGPSLISSCRSDDVSCFDPPSPSDLQFRHEFDDLAVLATAMESPSRGLLSNNLMGILASKASDIDPPLHIPIHLRLARTLASYTNGLIPPTESD